MCTKYLLEGLFVGAATMALTQMQGPGQQSTFPSQQASPGVPGLNNPMPTAPAQHQVDDRRFAHDAGVAALTDVEPGKLAEQKALHDNVKQFGQNVADQNSRLENQLETVASQASIQVPDSLSAKERSRIGKLSKLSGAAFDKEFVKNELKDRQRDVDAFRDEAQYGTDPRLKDFAEHALPQLKQSLETARNLKKETDARD